MILRFEVGLLWFSNLFSCFHRDDWGDSIALAVSNQFPMSNDGNYKGEHQLVTFFGVYPLSKLAHLHDLGALAKER